MKLKKLIAGITAAAVMLCGAAAMPESVFDKLIISASADDTEGVTADGFVYSLVTSDSGTYARVRAYDGTETDITIPADINGFPVIIGYGDFTGDSQYFKTYNNNNVKRVVISDGIAIENGLAGCFYDMENLTSVVIPKSIDKINYSFIRCPKLQKIELSEGLEEIDLSFRWCPSIKTVTLPESLTYIDSGDSSSFEACTSLTDFYVAADNGKYISIDGILYSRSQYNDEWNNDYLTLTKYPAGKRKTSFTVPENVSGIEELDPAGTLKSISVEEGNEYFSSIDGVLFYRNALKKYPFDRKGDSYTIPSGTTNWSISSKNLKKLTVSDGTPFNIRNVGICEKLTEIVLPADTAEGAFERTDCPFLGSNMLRNIRISDSSPYYKTIDGALFDKTGTKLIAYPSGRSTDQRAVIPDNTKIISHNLFTDNDYIKEVVMPDTVEEIEEGFCGAFQHSGIEKIRLSESLKNLPERTFSNSNDLKSVYIPGKVNSIGRFAFDQCKALSEVIIEEGVKTIGYGAFLGCLIKKLVLPKSMTEIGNYAFSLGDGKFFERNIINDVYYEGSEEEWNKISKNSGISDESNIHFNCKYDPMLVGNVVAAFDGKTISFNDLTELSRNAEFKKATGDVVIAINTDFDSDQVFSLPSKAASVRLTAASERSVFIKSKCLAAKGSLTIENITFFNRRSSSSDSASYSDISAKGDLNAKNCKFGKVTATGNVVLEDCKSNSTVTAKGGAVITDCELGGLTASGKSGTAVTTLNGNVLILNNLTVTDLVISEGADVTVNCKFTPKGSIEVNGHFTVRYGK